MAIQNTVLIGNGINRWIKDHQNGNEDLISWKSTLEQLAQRAHYSVRDIEQKPLTLVFDELLLKAPNLSKNDLQRLAMSAARLEGDPDLNSVYSCVSKQILTTNYYANFAYDGYGCSKSLMKYMDWAPLFPNFKENTFSLFRAMKYKSRIVWSIHGVYPVSTSITLGLRQYARYQNRIADYLNYGVSFAKEKGVRSPLYLSRPNFDFEKSGAPYSWADLFLRDHIHMVGFGMEYTESILWWLLTEKIALQRKYPKLVGGLTYHHVEVDKVTPKELVKLHMLEDLGAQINRVSAKDYKTGYLEIANTIKPGILKAHKIKGYV